MWRKWLQGRGRERGDTGIVNPEPALREYGGDRTIHHTEHLSVEVSASGEVVAVWFRCQMLPFKGSFADTGRARQMRSMYANSDLPSIHSVTLRDPHRDRDNQ